MAPDETDPELEALLEEVASSMPSTDEVDAWVEEIASGELPSPAPATPAWEAVTATTAGEYSRGELEQRIMRAWRRERMSFTEAARRAAEQDRRGRPRATRSTEAGDAEYAARWAVTLMAADYEPGAGTDLSDVARLLRRGSPFQRSLRGSFDRVVPVENPTGGQIVQSIDDAVFAMNESLPAGELGQLVVTFSGHGANGRVVGVDGEAVTPARLGDLAEIAGLFRVQVVYVLDTCRAGTLAQVAQGEEHRDIRDQLDEMPEDRRAELEPVMDLAKDLGQRLFEVGQRVIDVGDAAKAYRKRRSDENALALLETLFEQSDANTALQRFLQTPTPDTAPDLAPLAEHVQDLSWSTLAAMGLRGRRPANTVLRRAAVVLDEGGDVINGLLQFVSQEIAADASAAATSGG